MLRLSGFRTASLVLATAGSRWRLRPSVPRGRGIYSRCSTTPPLPASRKRTRTTADMENDAADSVAACLLASHAAGRALSGETERFARNLPARGSSGFHLGAVARVRICPRFVRRARGESDLRRRRSPWCLRHRCLRFHRCRRSRVAGQALAPSAASSPTVSLCRLPFEHQSCGMTCKQRA